jgi:hypothetical protein
MGTVWSDPQTVDSLETVNVKVKEQMDILSIYCGQSCAGRHGDRPLPLQGRSAG